MIRAAFKLLLRPAHRNPLAVGPPGNGPPGPRTLTLTLRLLQVFDQRRAQDVLMSAPALCAKCLEPHEQRLFQLDGLNDRFFLC